MGTNNYVRVPGHRECFFNDRDSSDRLRAAEFVRQHLGETHRVLVVDSTCHGRGRVVQARETVTGVAYRHYPGMPAFITPIL